MNAELLFDLFAQPKLSSKRWEKIYFKSISTDRLRVLIWKCDIKREPWNVWHPISISLQPLQWESLSFICWCRKKSTRRKTMSQMLLVIFISHSAAFSSSIDTHTHTRQRSERISFQLLSTQLNRKSNFVSLWHGRFDYSPIFVVVIAVAEKNTAISFDVMMLLRRRQCRCQLVSSTEKWAKTKETYIGVELRKSLNCAIDRSRHLSTTLSLYIFSSALECEATK